MLLLALALLGSRLVAAAATPVLAQQVLIPVTLSYDQNADVFHVTFSISDPSAVRRLLITVEDNGTTVVEKEVFVQGRPTVEMDLETTNLKPGGQYTLNVQAEDFNGNSILAQGNNNQSDPRILTVKQFTYNKAAVDFKIQAVDARYDLDNLLIDLSISADAAAQVASYEVIVVDAGDEKVLDSGPQVFTGLPLQVKLTDAMLHPDEPQAYKVTVDLTAKDGTPYEQVLDGFKPAPPPEPSLLSQATAALQKNPLLEGGVVLIVMIAVSWVIFNGQRKKATDEWARPPIDQTMTGRQIEVSAAGQMPANGQQGVHMRVTRTPGGRAWHRADCHYLPLCDWAPRVRHQPAGRSPNLPASCRNHRELGRLFLTDLGSTNGTFLGDTQLAPRTPVALNGGRMIVRLGSDTQIELQPAS